MITDDFYYHTIILVVIRPVKPVKPGLAGCNRPKPSEALETGSGFKLYRPEASQSWAVDPAFRPSRAGKSLGAMIVMRACRRSMVVSELLKTKQKMNVS